MCEPLWKGGTPPLRISILAAHTDQASIALTLTLVLRAARHGGQRRLAPAQAPTAPATGLRKSVVQDAP